MKDVVFKSAAEETRKETMAKFNVEIFRLKSRTSGLENVSLDSVIKLDPKEPLRNNLQLGPLTLVRPVCYRLPGRVSCQ